MKRKREFHCHTDLRDVRNPDQSDDVISEPRGDVSTRLRHLTSLIVVVNRLRQESSDMNTRRICQEGLRAIGILTEEEQT